MKGYIDGIDFINIEPMKYWSVPASKLNEQHNIVRNAIFSGEYGGALKVDGYYERIVKDEDGNCFMIARSRNVNGEVVNKIEWLPQITNWLQSLPNGTCFLTECYRPGEEGSKGITQILGCLKDKALERQKTNPLHLYVFDIMAYNNTNFLKIQYIDRMQKISELSKIHIDNYIEYAEYYEDAELWDKLGEFLADGREGMVIMRKDAIVYQKRTPARVSIKCKKEISDTIDCFFTGRGLPPTKEYTGKELETWKYWINSLTGEKLEISEHYFDYTRGAAIMPVTKPYYNDWMGSLEIGLVKGDKVVPIGYLSGLTDEIKANWEQYKGRVIKISAMEIGFDENKQFSGLRHAKMLGFRSDKSYKDCLWSQIEE